MLATKIIDTMFPICAVVITILELEKAKPVRGSAVEISGEREREILYGLQPAEKTRGSLFLYGKYIFSLTC